MEHLLDNLKSIAEVAFVDPETVRPVLAKAMAERDRLERERSKLESALYRAEKAFISGQPCIES